MKMNVDSLMKEFDRQIENLLQREYPKLANISNNDFLKKIKLLQKNIEKIFVNYRDGSIPFVVVVKNELVSTEKAMSMVEVGGARGVVNMDPVNPDDFGPIKSLTIPKGTVYLMIGVSTGRDSLNIRPEDALKNILKNKRYPLTIDEGVALVTQFPDVLIDKQKYNCFQMAGSRRSDQRVPSIWMSYKKPRLGWCWDRNPHTWLGSASCAGRE